MSDTKIKIEGDKEKYLTNVKKSKKIPLIIAGFILLVLVVLAGYFVFGGKEESSNTNNTTAEKQGLVRRVIDGVFDTSANRNTYPVALMIENLVTIRPQTGLDKAGIVYEALVEGGITRFMAVYSFSTPIEKIGPVRSARPYYLDWVKEYNALYGHVGGSPTAMSLISSYDVFNLDQFYDSRYYWRDKAREAPHNVYTSSDLLTFALRDKKAAAEGNYTGYKFKEEAGLDQRPTEEKTIAIDYSSYSYKVEYKYERTKNVYLRSQGGKPFESEGAGQIAAKNVVVQYVKTSVADESRLTMKTIGEGQAIIFRDGQAVTGTWEKQGRNTRTKFFDADGVEVQFDAGQTWIQIVPDDRAITYN